MGSDQPKNNKAKQCLLWGTVVLISLTMLVLGIVLTVRASRDDPSEGKHEAGTPPSPQTTTQAPTTTTTTTTPGSPYFYNSPYGKYRYAAVAGDADPCSVIGTDILAKQGGSAVDAAIAGILCIGVVNFHSNGIGGGHFMTIYERPNNGTEKQFLTILARERAPAAATEKMFVNASSLKGGLAIAVPGEVKGLYEAWERFGRLPWKELVQPSIVVCQRGLIVNDDLAFWAARLEEDIRNNPGLSALLVKKDGSMVKQGDRIVRPKLEKTLHILASNPTSFYDPNSQLFKNIIADLEEAGAIIRQEDLVNYQTYIKPPITVKLQNGNYTVYSPPPPSGGLILEYILNILDGYKFNENDQKDTQNKVLTYHRITEAFKYAYAKRSQLADEEFVPEVMKMVQNLTSEWYADDTRSKIDDNKTYNISHYGPSFQMINDKGTAHINVLTADGSAVALTSTINYLFGAQVVGNRTGIIFNNEMDDFSTPNTTNVYGVPASPANFIKPGKMPLSSMAPTLIANSRGEIVLVIGSSGGTWITTSLASVIMQSLWFGLDMKEAVDHPRPHHQLVPNILKMEAGFDADVKTGLEAKGHEIEDTPFVGFVQSIIDRCDPDSLYDISNCITAVSDARKAGHTDGY